MSEKSAMSSDVYVELDVGNLCVTRTAYLKDSLSSAFSEELLKKIATCGTQELVNEIFKLPTKYHEHVPIAKLPEPITIIPREKPLPKPKKPTKWETFAKQKGIQKKKKEKLLWDEKTKEWKPQFGYRGINKKDDWLIEIPENGDPNIDYFAKEKEVKKEKMAKNEYQRLKNIAQTNKMKVSNFESADKANKEKLSGSYATAKASKASMNNLPKEKTPKNNMKKRKFKSNIPNSMKNEKEYNLKILQELDRKKPKLDIKEAVELHMAKSQKLKKSENSTKKKSKSKKNKKFNKFSQNGKQRFKKSKKPAFKT